MNITGIKVARLSQQDSRGESEAAVWGRWYRRAAQLAGLVVVLGFAYGVGTSEYFWIREVQVIAPTPQLAQQVLAQIEVPATASALFYPAEKLARTVEECPTIKRAEVKPDLPSRLVIQVWPRVPVAAIKSNAGFLLVDEEGMCISQTPETPVDLIQIYGLIGQPIAAGQTLKPHMLHLLTECVTALEGEEVKAGLIIDFAQRYSIRLCTAAGVQGKVGSPDNLQRKIMMFAAILKDLQRRGAQPAYIDVRIMDRPVWKP